MRHPPPDLLDDRGEWRRADQRLRRHVLLGLVAGLVLLLGGIILVERYLDVLVELAEHDIETAAQQAWRLLVLVVGGGVALLLVLLVLVMRFALSAYATRCWPPEGARVLRDTLVVRGRMARIKAVAMMAWGMVLAFLGMAMLIYLYGLYRLLIWPA